jgi:hypothetical protein
LWLSIVVATGAIVVVYRTIRRREIKLETEGRNSFVEEAAAKRSTRTPHRRSSLIVPKRLSQAKLFSGFHSAALASQPNGDDLAEAEADEVLKAIEAMPSARKQNVTLNAFGSRAVFMQAMHYTCAFYVSYTFATVNRILQQVTGETYFPVIFLHALLIPLQGFFNVLVYRRNEYIRLVQRYPYMSKWDRFRRTWRFSFLGPPKEINGPMKSKDPEQPSVLKDPADSGKAADMKRPSAGVSFHINFAGEVSAGLNSPQQETDSHDDDPLQNRDDTSSNDFVNHAADNVMDFAMMDLTASYADFPNMLTEDSVMMTMDAPQAFPTMIHASAASDDVGSAELTGSGFFASPLHH